jgi:S1-C subfamily serine protease
MPHAHRACTASLASWAQLGAIATLAMAITGSAGLAQSTRIEELVSAVVRIKTHVNPEGRTVEGLGREREGSGILIDNDGLVLTIGYLMVEAYAAEVVDNSGRTVPASVVGYDHETGFGLLRALEPLAAVPVPLGSSGGVAIGDPLLVLSRDGGLGGRQVGLVSRREFAGYWEYLLPDALFTTPPHSAFAGAALIDREGRLVGIGSLFVGDAAAEEVASPGNMFVPIDALKPIMGDLLALGRRDAPGHPWVGVSALEHAGHVIVRSVADDGPAETAGVRPGDVLLAVGDTQVGTLAELYREIWGLGQPGVTVPLRVMRQNRILELSVPSVDRMRWLRLNQTY